MRGEQRRTERVPQHIAACRLGFLARRWRHANARDPYIVVPFCELVEWCVTQLRMVAEVHIYLGIEPAALEYYATALAQTCTARVGRPVRASITTTSLEACARLSLWSPGC